MAKPKDTQRRARGGTRKKTTRPPRTQAARTPPQTPDRKDTSTPDQALTKSPSSSTTNNSSATKSSDTSSPPPNAIASALDQPFQNITPSTPPQTPERDIDGVIGQEIDPSPSGTNSTSRESHTTESDAIRLSCSSSSSSSPSDRWGMYFGASGKTHDTWDLTFPKYLSSDTPEIQDLKQREHQALLMLVSARGERRILGDQIQLWRAVAGNYKLDLSADRVQRVAEYSAEGEDLVAAYNDQKVRLAFLAGNTRASVYPPTLVLVSPAPMPARCEEGEEEL